MPIQFQNYSLFGDPNLVAYYKLEDLTATVGSTTLTNNNSVTFTQAEFGNGANLGTSNTNKSLTSGSSYGVTSACSISAWIKILAEPGVGADYTLIGVADATSHIGFYITYRNTAGTTNLNYCYLKQNVLEIACGANETLGTTVIHHVVGTYDGANLNCYLDGVLIAGPTAASGAGTTGTTGFAIGQRPDVALFFSSALIDDVAMLSRALTASEISNLYNENLRTAPSGGSFSSPLAY